MPWKLPVRVGGAPICSRAWSTSTVAWPSDTPGARLNDRVAAGNWPWWLMVTLAVELGSIRQNRLSGTVLLVSGDST